MSRPKILYVVSNFPVNGTGAQQRALNIGKLLKRAGDVSLVVAIPGDFDPRTLEALDPEFKGWRVIQPSRVVWRNPFTRLWNRIQRTLGTHLYSSHYWKINDANLQAFRDMMAGFDVIWVHNLQTVNAFGLETWPDTILDIDDVPSTFYGLLAKSRRNPLKRIVDLYSARQWKRREARLLNRFEMLTVCSDQDKEHFGGDERVFVVPNGFRVPEIRRRIRPARPRIGFIGMFDYFPNTEGMQWFIKEVWPLIRIQTTNVELRLAGPGSDTFLSKPSPDVSGLGWLDSPAEEIASWSAMIVPIQVGGGTRIKIAEGFARKCPVVSTSTGALGYDVHNGRELLLADSPTDFASACLSLLHDPAFGDTLADRAHQRFLREWTWDASAARVSTVVKACLSNRAKPLANCSDQIPA
jgi:glycosyltransferase involved in cell wall biosynthesis